MTKKLYHIYLRLMKLNFSELKAYRTNLVNTVIGSLVWGIFAVAAPLLITSKVTSVLGWSRIDLLVLAACQSILIGLFDCLFARGLSNFPSYVEKGQLDAFLLKPMNTQFIVSLHRINFGSLIRLMIGIGFLTFLVRTYHIEVTLAGTFFGIVALLLGMIALYGIWFMVMILTLWFSRLTNISDLLFTIRGITRFPQELFREISVYLFILLFPLTIIVTRPTSIFIGKDSLASILILVGIAGGILLLSHHFWKFALRSSYKGKK